MLEVVDVDAGYGPVQVLRGASLSVAPGEVLCLMGRNGAGKTTLLKTIMGLLQATAGTIRVNGTDLSARAAHQISDLAVGYVPQGRRLFTGLTVAENLEVGLMARKDQRGQTAAIRDDVLRIFPRLRERLSQRAETLSGGEQQMLATARALAVRPRYLLLDEPTEGLQPSMVESIEDVVRQMRDRGVGVLLVEQKVDAVERLADRVQFIENGQTHEDVAASELRRGDLLQRYVGV